MFSKVTNIRANFKHSCYWTNIDEDEIKDGLTILVKVVCLKLDEDQVLRITVTDPTNKEFITTAEFLRPPSNPDIGWIPTSVLEYKTSTTSLIDKEIEKISSLQHLLSFQQEF